MLPPPVPRPSTRLVHPDDAIRSTDDDAAASRLSAVNLGYLTDPYVSLLYRPPRMAGESTRKAPLINIGTHHRTAALDKVVESFLAAAEAEVGAGTGAQSTSPSAPSEPAASGSGNGTRTPQRTAQILSLGAGSDTRFWRLAAAHPGLHYVEVDFPHLTATKAQRIARSRVLTSALTAASPVPSSTSAPFTTPSSTPSDPPNAAPAMPPPPPKPYTVSHGGMALTSSRYALLPLDLRDAAALTTLLEYLDPAVPTLLVAECVLCYMTPEASRAVLRWFGETFARSAAVVYEMVGLDDAFGRVMRRNLAARNLSLPGATFATPAAQADRFRRTEAALGDAGFTDAGAMSLWEVRSKVVRKDELSRISRLEILDEIEELKLVLDHYCVAWASKGMAGVGL